MAILKEVTLGSKEEAFVITCNITNTGKMSHAFKVGGAIYDANMGMVIQLTESVTRVLGPGEKEIFNWGLSGYSFTKAGDYGVSLYVKDGGQVLDKEPDVGVHAGVIRVKEPAKPMAEITSWSIA